MQVDEAEVAKVLEHRHRVEPGSLLFIQARVWMKQLPTLCSLYRCFERETVWVNRSPEVRARTPDQATPAHPCLLPSQDNLACKGDSRRTMLHQPACLCMVEPLAARMHVYASRDTLL